MKQVPQDLDDKIEAFLNRKDKQFPDLDTIARTIFRA